MKTILHKIAHALRPTALELLCKSLKPEPVAEAPWTFDPTRDETAGHDPDSLSASREGVIRLFRLTSRFAGSCGAGPFVMAFFDGEKRYPLRMNDIHWRIPEFQPFKAEYDAWIEASHTGEAPGGKVQDNAPKPE